MSLRRLLSGTFVALAALASWAIAPASADAALLDPVQPAVETAAPAAQKVVADVAGAAESVSGPAQTPGPGAGTPAPRPGAGAVQAPAPQPVQQTVAPVAAAGGAAVSAPGATAASGRLDEGHRSRLRRISASAASAERLSAARTERGLSADGAPRAATGSTTPAPHAAADIHSSRHPSSSDAPARPAASPALPAEPSSGLAGADAATGASTGFSFGGGGGGGGLALLVAVLLLAAPRLRRRLLLLPAVCRPAAFHVVLERPG